MTVEQCEICNQLIDGLPVIFRSPKDWSDMCQDCARPLLIMVKELKRQKAVPVENN